MTKDGDLPKPDLNVLKYSSKKLKVWGFYREPVRHIL